MAEDYSRIFRKDTCYWDILDMICGEARLTPAKLVIITLSLYFQGDAIRRWPWTRSCTKGYPLSRAFAY